MAAGLWGPDSMPLDRSNNTRLRIIDLGFGCGDQSLYFAQLSNRSSPTSCLLDEYVGLTDIQSQFRFAEDRIRFCSDIPETRFKLFCADAAKPSTWTKDIHEAAMHTTKKSNGTDTISTSDQETWVLGLDTFYHFFPSRKPIFRHAFGKLDASIMAFDLLLSDTPSFWNLVILRFICSFAGIPFSNFITVTDYEDQLVAAGYDRNRVEIQDISNHVFAGIASFIERQDRELKGIGMTVGRYRGAGKMFKWWARSGLVRGCIVVARK